MIAYLAPVVLAAAAPDPLAAVSHELPRGQHAVQVLDADLDGDGKPERIAVGEPDAATPGHVSIAIYDPSVKPHALRFAQRLSAPGLSRAGAAVVDVDGVGPVVVLVGAAPAAGDSRFAVQLYGWQKTRFRPLVPEPIELRSQGGFAIEDVEPGKPGDELLAWTFLRGEGEQLHDQHVYAYRRWRFDGIRFVGEPRESRTDGKMPDAEAAGRAAGAKGGDLRRRIPRVAEVP